MDGSASRVGSGEMSFQCHRGLSVTTGVLLLITGVALVTLGSMGFLGPLKGVGAITGMALGGVDTLAILVIGLIAIRHNISWRSPSSATITTTTCSLEKLAHVKWYCPDPRARKRLGTLYQSHNEINLQNALQQSPENKLVIFIAFDERQGQHTFGEKHSPAYNLATELQEKMGERLLVVLDFESTPKRKKSVQNRNPGDLVAQESVWETIFSSGRYISTIDADWQAQLQAFIAK